MRFGFATRIALAMAAVLGVGVLMTSLLSLHKFERTLSEFLTSRFEFVMNDISQSIETQLDLGLSLGDLQTVSQFLEAQIRSDADILSMEVFDDTGTVIFSGDPSLVGDLVSESMVLSWRANRGKEAWFGLDADAVVVGVPLRNNLSQDVGALVLRYSRAYLDATVGFQTSRLLYTVIAILIAMTVLSFMGSALMLHRSSKDLRNMTVALDDLVADPYAGGKRWDDIENPGFSKFTSSVMAAHQEIDAATKEVHELDDEAGL